MDLPSVTTDVRDTANRVLWRVRAYRTVTEQEARAAITSYLRRYGVPKPNTELELITSIGLQD